MDKIRWQDIRSIEDADRYKQQGEDDYKEPEFKEFKPEIKVTYFYIACFYRGTVKVLRYSSGATACGKSEKEALENLPKAK